MRILFIIVLLFFFSMNLSGDNLQDWQKVQLYDKMIECEKTGNVETQIQSGDRENQIIINMLWKSGKVIIKKITIVVDIKK